jgi:hypothetical protein
MSTTTESQSRRERGWIYVTACVVLGLMFLGALITFSAARETRQAREKADQLIAAIEDAGATPPSRDQVVRVLGKDGGATCRDPNEALARGALLALVANGASGPGARPVIADSKIFKGQLLIMQVYCPEELQRFKDFVHDLETDHVAG